MGKQLIPDCENVILQGISIMQGKNPEGKWQAYIMLRGKIVDVDGNELPIGISAHKKEAFGSPQDNPHTFADFASAKDTIFTRIQSLMTEAKEEFAGITE